MSGGRQWQLGVKSAESSKHQTPGPGRLVLGSWIAVPCTSDSGVRCITQYHADEDLNMQNVWGSFSGRLVLAPTGRAGFSDDGTYGEH